ncbi:MAG: glycosyltransferase [Streptosporangiales bacterium]|nr:glycosyltransferase [Streptosporangiales bacterium]
MPASRFSVVICAYTADRLEQIKEAAGSVRAAGRDAEIILVVDHNPALYKLLVAELPGVTVTENAEAPGLSGARNTGVALAQGEIVAFLDDDAAAEPGWLEHLETAYADPDVTGVGGLTVPRWETSKPGWFPEEFYWVIGCNYLGMPASGQRVRNLIGANMSFRREAFQIAGGFRSDMGRTASGRPLGCEETEFCIRLGQRSPGAVLTTEYRAVARHLVPASRCRPGYFLSRCFAEGVSKARVSTMVGSDDGLSAERSYTTRTLPLGVLRGLGGALRGDAAGLGRAGAIVAGLAATVAGYAAGQLARVRSLRDKTDKPDIIMVKSS